MPRSQTILIPGGAGYIGSHTARLLAQQQNNVIVLDTFLHNQSFQAHNNIKVIKKDFANEQILDEIFTSHTIDAIMHFAAYIEVGESVKHPQRFYQNNVIKTLKLLDKMLKHNVKKFIFSSSCAVYGEPQKTPMDETHPCKPISPYGKNKLAIEFALQDYTRAYDLKYVSLRYFNASGALPKQGLGEQHDPETHIIPLMIRALQNNKTFKIFGTDYDTPDGSCIRDYIHVQDIANAHVLALRYLEQHNRSDAFNLGTGNGFSVKSMIQKLEQVTNKKLQIQEEPRRAGDPAVLLADQRKAKELLGWEPQNSDLDTILRSALEWEEKINSGAEIVSPIQPCSRSTSSADRARK